MQNPVQVVLVGIGGYGKIYIQKLLDEGKQLNTTIVGVVDPFADQSDMYEKVVEHRIPVFATMEEFYSKHCADLAVLSTPINLHAAQTCLALINGSHVLCEKPICASLEEAESIIKTRDETRKFVAIGFNWSFSPSVQNLKKDILDGVFGRPIRLKTIVNWPRNKDYYHRNHWAGRLYNDEGQPIFDSVANNATSHFLHHMLYLLGAETDRSAELLSVTAELYRANPIESFDTCAIKIKTKSDADIYFYATHAVKDSYGPYFRYEFEHATIYNTGEEQDHQVIAKFHDGSKKVYHNPEKDHLQKLETCIAAIQNGQPDILCGPEAALTQLKTIMAMHESVPKITEIPISMKRYEEEARLIWVEGLAETLVKSYEQWELPTDEEVSWAKRGKTISFIK